MFGENNMLRATRADPLLDGPAAEANHRIANSLSIVASLIHAQSENLPAEGTLPVTDFPRPAARAGGKDRSMRKIRISLASNSSVPIKVSDNGTVFQRDWTPTPLAARACASCEALRTNSAVALNSIKVQRD